MVNSVIMKSTIIITLLLFINLGCSQSKSKKITEVSQNELKSAMLLDVRTPEEYELGHLPNAVNINWFDENFIAEVEKSTSKEMPLYVYCKVGGRSAKAAEKLTSLGYTVVNLEGGYDAYSKAKK